VSDQADQSFNDAFLVTVDGVPVSLLPDASDFIGVTTIHPKLGPDTVPPTLVLINDQGKKYSLPAKNGHLYLDDRDDTAVNDIHRHVVTPAPQVEYDGMTIRLRLHALVAPLRNHRIRVVIADVNDQKLDSGLFLKSGSLRTLPLVP
jgi:hypothetical protein